MRMVSDLSGGSNIAVEPKCFLENGFPVRKLHTVAVAQGNAKMPIYQIHKWWARRLGSIFRALLISSFLDVEAKDFWKNYYDGFQLNKRIIWDPFMGGGTTLVEGLRLGCRVIGCDINPVAWFVTKKEIDPFDSEIADKYFKQLEQAVGREIRELYQTRCPLRRHKAEIIYSMWIRTLECGKCRAKHDLFSNFVIREKDTSRTMICPHCKHIFTSKAARPRCTCGYSIDLKNVPVENGIFTCPDCRTKERIVDAVRRIKGPLPTRMFCVEYLCQECGKRGYKEPNNGDIKLFREASRKLKKLKKELEYPKQKISIKSKTDNRPISHGFTHFHQLFNDRQLLSLAILLREIKKIPDDNFREYFLLTLSSCLETNNVLCKYETKWGKVSALFGLPTFHVPERYAENNLWGIGRGTFVRNYMKLKRGKKYSAMPYERVYYRRRSADGRLDWKEKRVGPGLTTNIITRGFNWGSGWNAVVDCRDSRRVKFIPKKSVDAVVTDPPYFETIRYSELADFFYVWLRLGLKNRYEWFVSRSSQRKEEAVARSTSENDTNCFVKKLTEVFKQAHRVLKDDGPLVFTFHHTQDWAWEGLRRALHDSGFRVTATPIIRSEGRTGYRKGNNIGYDMCIVCRKSDGDALPSVNSSSAKDYIEHVRELKGLGKTMTESEILTVIMGDYLKVDNKSAKDIMKNTPLLVKQIRKSIRIRDI
jgi:adenine-specific DNA methylase